MFTNKFFLLNVLILWSWLGVSGPHSFAQPFVDILLIPGAPQGGIQCASGQPFRGAPKTHSVPMVSRHWVAGVLSVRPQKPEGGPRVLFLSAETLKMNMGRKWNSTFQEWSPTHRKGQAEQSLWVKAGLFHHLHNSLPLPTVCQSPTCLRHWG